MRTDAAELGRHSDANDALRAEILSALNRPPFHLVLRDFDLNDPDACRHLLKPIAPHEKLSFTRVRIDAEAAAKPSQGTRYSRTHLPLTLHTDSAHARRPHSLVAFLMVRPDQLCGGVSTVAPAAEVLACLNPGIVEALRRPVFPFGRDPMPIVWGPAHDPRIRYYRTQIDACLDAGESLSKQDLEALDTLDAALVDAAETSRLWLNAGDLLLVNNVRALHGRTGFAEDSDRLMLRYRLSVTGLE